MKSAHQRAKEARTMVADKMEAAAVITYGEQKVTRDGDKTIRIRFQGPDDHAPVYVRVEMKMEP